MIVMKFGGTSVANAEAIKRTIEIVRSRLDKKPIVVVSALAKVTDALYNISYAAENCVYAILSLPTSYWEIPSPSRRLSPNSKPNSTNCKNSSKR